MKRELVRRGPRKAACRTALLLSGISVALGCHDEPNTNRSISATTPLKVESACADGLDDDQDGPVDCEDTDCQSPGGECVPAPPLDRTVATTVTESAAYLYRGENPLQKAVAANAIDARRVAMLRGRAIDADGTPLSGVKVSVNGHPEFGYTYTRGDGVFDLAVNGGTRWVLTYERVGHVPSQRAVAPGWQRHVALPDVGLITTATSTTVIYSDESDVQLVIADTMRDELGERTPLVVMEPNTIATAVVANGQVQPLSELHVSVTEYPITEQNVYSPGSAVSAGGLQYGLEFAITEADALGAEHVAFSAPVSIYVENLAELTTGTKLAVEHYDRALGQWESGEKGSVIEVLDVNGGVAALDSDGDGRADPPEQLEQQGITEHDCGVLAARYKAGQRLWHAELRHFSAGVIQAQGTSPKGAVAPVRRGLIAKPLDNPTYGDGILIETQASSHSEPVIGTPYDLRYQSDRTTSYGAGRTLEVPLVGDSVPAGLKQVKSRITVANRVYEQTVTPTANLRQIAVWDGKDAQGRLVQGQQLAEVSIEYVYSDAKTGTLNAVLPVSFTVPLSNWDARAFGLGGFSLSVHHAYDPAQNILYFGHGGQRSGANVALAAKPACSDETFPLGTPDSLVVTSDGTLIVTDDQHDTQNFGRVLHLAPNGSPKVLFGEGADTSVAAGVSMSQPQGVVVMNDGRLIVADIADNKLLELSPDGTVRVLVSGDPADSPAVQQELVEPDGIALGPRQELYFVDADRVYRFEAGQVSVIAGGGSDLADDIDATTAKLVVPSALAVDKDGNLYVSERGRGTELGGHRVRRVSRSGTITTVAGTAVPGYSGDGELAKSAQLQDPHGLALDPEGQLYIVDQGNQRIRRVSSDGLIQTVIGGGTEPLLPGSLAVNIKLEKPDGIAVGPDGSLYVAMAGQVFRAFVGIPQLNRTDHLVPSLDGRTLYHFDERGRHLETINAMTGVIVLRFGYKNDQLDTVTDSDNQATRIERDDSGKPLSITAPYGQKTVLETLDGNLAKITDPLGRTTTVSWDPEKLAQVVDDPKSRTRIYGYDTTGRLRDVNDPTGSRLRLERTEATNGWNVSLTHVNTNRTSSYSVVHAAGEWSRIRVVANGTKTIFTDAGASLHEIAADGTRHDVTFTADTSFGAQALNPYEETLTLPSGRTLMTTHTRLKQLNDIYNPLDVVFWEESSETNGRWQESEYTRASRTLTQTTPTGRTSETQFNPEGRPISLIREGIPSVAWTYDAGQVKSKTRHADGQSRTDTFGYDAGGWLSAVTDALHQSTTYVRDPVGRLTAATAPDTATTLWSLDDADNVKSLTPPGSQTHTFEYDPKGKWLTSEIPPAINPAGAGSLSFQVDPTTLRLTKISRADGRSIALGYDTYGRLATQTLEKATTSYGYSNSHLTHIARSDSVTIDQIFDGPLWTSSTWSGAISGSVEATYDDNLWLSSLTVNDASTVNFSYDDDGLLASATTSVGGVVLTRDPNSGNVTGTTVGHTTSAVVLSGFGELSELSVAAADANLFEQIVVERDALGRVLHLTETVQGTSHDVHYTYDLGSRLATETRDGVTRTYVYDLNGNRKSVQLDADAPVTATYDAQDRIQNFGAAQYTHDAHGDLKLRTDGTKTLTLAYDELGNLLQAVKDAASGTGADGSGNAGSGASTKTIDYKVDGLGRRVSRSINGQFDRKWLYRDALRPIAEIDSAGVFTHFIYPSHDALSGAPIAMVRAGVLYRIVTDHLGSVRLVVNAETGEVAQSLDYDAWGRIIAESGAGFQPFGFAGGLYDADTKLVRFGARDYDSESGRWTNRDPIGFAGQQGNVYVYVGDDPVNGVDPDGRRPLTGKEEVFLRDVFGESLDISEIDLDAGVWDDAGYQAFGEDIRLPKAFFRNGNTDCGLNLSNTKVASWFVHEAFHIWQRQRGVWVTIPGAAVGLLRVARVYNPYKYHLDKSPAANLAYFLSAPMEVQATMFEHGVRARLEGNTQRLPFYSAIIDYVRTH